MRKFKAFEVINPAITMHKQYLLLTTIKVEIL